MSGIVHSSPEIVRAIRNVLAAVASLRERDTIMHERQNSVKILSRITATFNLKFGTKLEQSIHEIIVKHAHAAELLGPGGFDSCIDVLLRKIDELRPGQLSEEPKINSVGIVGNTAAIPKREDLTWVLDAYLKDHDLSRSMLEKALDLSGFAGRIIVEKARRQPGVELVRGYTFDQSPAWPISVRLERPRVICIDGYVESVSELHHLLEAASETKEHVALFVRGLSDDVKHTIRVNYDRGSLRIVPIVTKFDLDGINVMNDISIAAGAELISSNKGDLISNVKLSDSPIVDEVVVYPTKVSITNPNSRRAVDVQVAFLREKRLKEKNDDIAKLFDKRIRSLSPNHVVIRLLDDRNYVSRAQAIDYALRAVKSLVEHGTVAIDDQKHLTATVLASNFHANNCLRTLNELGSVITEASTCR